MSATAVLVVVVLLLPVAMACFKISDWHRQESSYWSDVAWKVRLDPRLDEHYRPILRWAQANRPSLIARLREWKSPDVRMAATS